MISKWDNKYENNKNNTHATKIIELMNGAKQLNKGYIKGCIKGKLSVYCQHTFAKTFTLATQ